MRGAEQVPWLYDLGMAVMEATGLDRWRRWLVGGARGRTLEVGAGTGRNLPLYPADVAAIAAEPHLDSARAARRRAPGVPLVVARAEALPFKDGAFDTVVSSLVFCSVDEPGRGLAEVRRVLREGGALRMLEHVRSHRPLAAWWQDRIQPAWTWFTGGCRPNRETERLVEAAGFRVDPGTRRASGNLRRFEARVAAGGD